MELKFSLVLTCLFFFFHLTAQEDDVSKYRFSPTSPLNYPLMFSGTFGELRSNHFHMGLDLKSSKGVSGDKIHAVAAGYISRIKVEPGGYGQAVYITHPEGIITVYAHLQDFTPDIKKIVRDTQRARESFAVDIKFNMEDSIPELCLERGEHFAFMGSKGHSFGPHLHFETRDSKTGKAINPLLFDFEYIDQMAPKINFLVAHYYDDNMKEIQQKKVPVTYVGQNKYRLNSKLISPAPYVNFSISTRDKMNSTPNNNGVYGITLFNDEKIVFQVKMDSIAYEASRYLNAYINYPFYHKNKSKLHRLHTIPVNKTLTRIFSELDIFNHNPINSVISLSDTTSVPIRIDVQDKNGNSSNIEFEVFYKPEKTEIYEPYNYFLPYDEPSLIALRGYELYFPDSTLYENLKINVTSPEIKDSDCLTQSLGIVQDDVPLHLPIKVSYQIDDELIDTQRTFIALCKGREIINIGDKQDNGKIIGLTRKLGTFCVMRDTIVPKIKPLSIFKIPSKNSVFKFKYSDNVKSSSYSENYDIIVRLDGAYTYYEIESKTNRIMIPTSEMEKLNKVRHLYIKLVDSVGNYTEYNHDFTY